MSGVQPRRDLFDLQPTHQGDQFRIVADGDRQSRERGRLWQRITAPPRSKCHRLLFPSIDRFDEDNDIGGSLAGHRLNDAAGDEAFYRCRSPPKGGVVDGVAQVKAARSAGITSRAARSSWPRWSGEVKRRTGVVQPASMKVAILAATCSAEPASQPHIEEFGRDRVLAVILRQKLDRLLTSPRDIIVDVHHQVQAHLVNRPRPAILGAVLLNALPALAQHLGWDARPSATSRPAGRRVAGRALRWPAPSDWYGMLDCATGFQQSRSGLAAGPASAMRRPLPSCRIARPGHRLIAPELAEQLDSLFDSWNPFVGFDPHRGQFGCERAAPCWQPRRCRRRDSSVRRK